MKLYRVSLDSSHVSLLEGESKLGLEETHTQLKFFEWTSTCPNNFLADCLTTSSSLTTKMHFDLCLGSR